MAYNLIKASGDTHSWTALELGAILARMLASEQVLCVGAEGIAFMNARDGLLLVDAEWTIGRKLTESFTVEARSGQPYGIGFISGATVVSVNAALSQCGYSGTTPVANLASVYMLYFDVSSAKYAQNATVSGVGLIQSEGILGGASAKIKTLIAGSGVTLDGGTNSVTVSAVTDSRIPILDDFAWNDATQLLTYSRGGIQALNRLRAAGGGVALVDVQGGSHSVRLACRPDKVELVAQTQCPFVFQTYNGTAQIDALRLEASGSAAVQSLTIGGLQAVTSNDARLSDARTPSSNSVTNDSVSDGALSAVKISGLSGSLGDKAPLHSPLFTGEPRGTKASMGDNSTWLATTSFVVSTLANLVGAAPSTLDTLAELATALGNDANFSATVVTAIGLKADSAATTASLALKANLTGADFTGYCSISGQNYLQFGSGIARESSAGRMGYTLFSDAFDIVGAGTASGSRNVKIWDNLEVPGTLTRNGQSVVTTDDSRFGSFNTDLSLKANIASPTFTGTVGGITKSMIGLSSADNTSDTAKPVSTAQQAALDLKASLSGATFTGQINITGTTVLQMGSGVVGRETSAGKITYGGFSSNASLDIVGAGTVSGSRVVKVYDNLIVGGTVSSTGAITVGGVATTLTNDSRLSDTRVPTALSVVDASVSATAAIAQSKISGLVTAIANAALLTDSRFTDTRTPTAGSVVDASVSASAGIAQSKISGLVAALATKVATGDSSLLLNSYSVLAPPTIVLQMSGGTKWSLASNSTTHQFALTRGSAGTNVMTAEQSNGFTTFWPDVSFLGTVYNPSQPYVFATLTTVQSFPSSTQTVILFNSPSTTGSGITYTAANGRFTVSLPGLYTIEATCRLANYSTNIRSVLLVLKNGAVVWEVDGSAGNQLVLTLMLAATDYIQIAVYNSGSTANASTGANTGATMRFVG